MKSQAYQFLYKEVNVGFMLNPNNNNLIVNATQMAKIFDKRIANFLRLEETQRFIKILSDKKNGNFAPSDVREQNEFDISDVRYQNIIQATNKATFMCRELAIYFAFWLDLEFQLWIIETIDSILFGHYKKHWEAHALQEENKQKMEKLKKKILTAPTPELVAEYFECENTHKNANAEKRNAIKNQLNLFNYLQTL